MNAVYPGETPSWNALPADNPGFIAELEQEYSYDPEAAKKLLADAGIENLTFEVTVSGESQRPWEVLQPCSGSAESEGGDPDRHDDDSGEDG